MFWKEEVEFSHLDEVAVAEDAVGLFKTEGVAVAGHTLPHL